MRLTGVSSEKQEEFRRADAELRLRQQVQANIGSQLGASDEEVVGSRIFASKLGIGKLAAKAGIAEQSEVIERNIQLQNEYNEAVKKTQETAKRVAKNMEEAKIAQDKINKDVKQTNQISLRNNAAGEFAAFASTNLSNVVGKDISLKKGEMN